MIEQTLTSQKLISMLQGSRARNKSGASIMDVCPELDSLSSNFSESVHEHDIKAF